MPRWVVYMRAGKGYASRTRILLDAETRPVVFDDLEAAKREAGKHEGGRVERVEDVDGGNEVGKRN